MQEKKFTEEVYNKYALNIKKYLFTLTKDIHIIDEVICDVFIAFAYCDINFSGNEIYLRNWLYKVANNKFKDYYRRNKRLLKNECELNEKIPGLAYEFADNIESKEESKIIREAIRGLPKKQREVVFYHFIEGLSYEEISKINGGIISTIRGNCMKGINNLKKNLKNLNLE